MTASHRDSPSVRRPALAATQIIDGTLALGLFLVSGALVLWGGEATESLRISSWPVVAILLCGAVVFRRSVPLLALVLAWAGALIQVAFVQEVGPESVAILVVLYSTAAYGSRVVSILGLISAVIGGLLAGWFLAIAVPSAEGSAPGSVPFLATLCVLILFVAWLLGTLRVVSSRATRERVAAGIAAEQARHAIAVEEERARIARDVHDVVAHSLTVMIAQAEGVRMIAETRGTADAGSLITIAETGRAALAEVRSVLAELREGERDSPQPSLARLEGLLTQLRSSGARVTMTETGDRRTLAAQVDAAAFRIVQEALTNAIRHGRAAEEISLHLAWAEEALEVTVTNPVTPGVKPSGGGHGIVGMHERAHHVGGTVRTSALLGFFTLTAFLPLDRRGTA
ncbi:DUF7134 domain-containing protein [Microbacterium gorillae]|uniref:sensor histidine kinase n=1 Tax=Microbacterium gorillae TaxID=1231063 RepID=UPI003D971368